MKPLCMGGDNSLDNLIALCKTCHRQRHCSWKGYKNAATTVNREVSSYA
jgi:5-methylcytosine-specific restriction endonuclease McrA